MNFYFNDLKTHVWQSFHLESILTLANSDLNPIRTLANSDPISKKSLANSDLNSAGSELTSGRGPN